MWLFTKTSNDIDKLNRFVLLGWEVAGDHIRSGAGSLDNDYLILNIHIPGFKCATLSFVIDRLSLLWLLNSLRVRVPIRLPTSMSSQAGTEFGRITFEFETTCTADCELYFMMVGEEKKKERKICFKAVFCHDANRFNALFFFFSRM